MKLATNNVTSALETNAYGIYRCAHLKNFMIGNSIILF